MVERGHDAADDVVHVGEVALVVAVVEDVDRLAGQDVAGEQEQRHVRPAPGAIDGEEAQARDRQPIEIGVGVRHHLVGLLGRGVERQRVLGVLVHRERHLRVGAVDGAGRGEDQVLDLVVTATLQDVQRADQVAVGICMGVLDGIAHARLRGQVHHALEARLCKQRVDAGSVGQVQPAEREVVVVPQDLEPRFLQRRVVVVVQVIEPDDLVATVEQAAGRVEADEAGGAGDQNFHSGLRIADSG